MSMYIGSIERIIEHLKDLSPKNRASVIDHLFIIISGVLMMKESFLGSSFTDMQNQVGAAFAPYVVAVFSMGTILCCLYGCDVIVHRLTKDD